MKACFLCLAAMAGPICLLMILGLLWVWLIILWKKVAYCSQKDLIVHDLEQINKNIIKIQRAGFGLQDFNFFSKFELFVEHVEKVALIAQKREDAELHSLIRAYRVRSLGLVETLRKLKPPPKKQCHFCNKLIKLSFLSESLVERADETMTCAYTCRFCRRSLRRRRRFVVGCFYKYSSGIQWHMIESRLSQKKLKT